MDEEEQPPERPSAWMKKRRIARLSLRPGNAFRLLTRGGPPAVDATRMPGVASRQGHVEQGAGHVEQIALSSG
jgi:hypothetical protein